MSILVTCYLPHGVNLVDVITQVKGVADAAKYKVRKNPSIEEIVAAKQSWLNWIHFRIDKEKRIIYPRMSRDNTATDEWITACEAGWTDIVLSNLIIPDDKFVIEGYKVEFDGISDNVRSFASLGASGIVEPTSFQRFFENDSMSYKSVYKLRSGVQSTHSQLVACKYFEQKILSTLFMKISVTDAAMISSKMHDAVKGDKPVFLNGNYPVSICSKEVLNDLLGFNPETLEDIFDKNDIMNVSYLGMRSDVHVIGTKVVATEDLAQMSDLMPDVLRTILSRLSPTSGTCFSCRLTVSSDRRLFATTNLFKKSNDKMEFYFMNIGNGDVSHILINFENETIKVKETKL